MKLRLVAAALLLLGIVCLGHQAKTQLSLTGVGGGYGGAAVYVGPGDVIGGWSAFWGLRGYTAATTGVIAVICDSATGATCANATWSAGVLTLPNISGSPCNNSTNTCVVNTLKDQTGGGNDLVGQSGFGASGRPALVINCLSTLPCMSFTAASQIGLQTGAAMTVPQPMATSLVAERTGNFSSINAGIRDDASAIEFSWNNSANSFSSFAGTGSIFAGVTDSAFHALEGEFNAASSFVTVDGGTANTGNPGTNGITNKVDLGVRGGLYLQGQVVEAGLPPSWTSTQANNVAHNQCTYWGFTTC